MMEAGASDDEDEGASDDEGREVDAFGQAVCLVFCLFIKPRFSSTGSEGSAMRRRQALDDR